MNYTITGETNLIGVHAEGNYTRVMGEMHALMGMKLFAEYLDAIAVYKFGATSGAAARIAKAAKESNLS